MTSTPKTVTAKHVPESDISVPSPLAGSGPGGHKPSFKSTKLARRARSFKDDFLEKISQIRSPTNQGIRSHSPKSRMHKPDTVDGAPSSKGPVNELDVLAKQVQVALKHFRDVVSKNILEMLPGNGTIVLDTVWAINLAVKSSVSSEFSNSIVSATHHMYQSVARLIKLCDDVLIDGAESSALNQDNVTEVVAQVEDAVKTLIKLAKEKIMHQHTISYKTTPRSSFGNASLDISTQRNSLPDIPLTPRERQILEQTSCVPGKVRSSHSSESVLRDNSPPPKPPLPDSMYNMCRMDESNVLPPPLPPKKKGNNRSYQLMDECFSSDNSLFASSLERISLRSRSPEDSSSLLSASAGSLDSMLNQSREEEEIRALMDHHTDADALVLDNDISGIAGANGIDNYWDDSLLSNVQDSSISLLNQSNELNITNKEMNRLSNADSGFVSMVSQRSSGYSKRSSQQSTVSSQWSSQQGFAKHSVTEITKSENVIQKTFTSQSRTEVNFKHNTSSSSTVSNFHSNGQSFTRDEVFEEAPPAIPQKTRRKPERQPSPYDNVPDDSLSGELLVACQLHQSQNTPSSDVNVVQDGKPPPLPLKKKHIMAYMEMFGNCSHANDQEFMRHSIHMVQGQWVQPQSPGMPTTQSCTFSHSSQTSSRFTTHSQVQTLTLQSIGDNTITTPSPLKSPNSSVMSSTSNGMPPALPPKRTRARTKSNISEPPMSPTLPERKSSPVKSLPDLLEHTTSALKADEKQTEKAENDEYKSARDLDLIEELDVSKQLVIKKSDEDGPEIRGGQVDALIIMATKATKNGEEKENVFTYQEAFLTTYRTFISPYELINKLIRRYNHFYCIPDRKPRSREAFALIVRVVSDLTPSDLGSNLQQVLMDFVQQLISCGELTLAKALRVKHLEKHEAKKRSIALTNYQSSLTLCSRISTLLDFKSEQIAEQMTLLDADLFMKIEIPEVLIWAQEQNEERSPNLTRFTEHFNKMSYWARTRILSVDAKDREKYFMKYIKIMKHLRKINNFNSYLALLSALDSAPIRRLEWQKHVQEGLKEYCALIDSSSSFRAYRQALAETQPPCIPYIGLVLQDLTFVHIGNSNLLQDGSINFSKRWQQFNIVENMKRFKKCTYSFKKNDRIINFFQNFDDFIGEDAMWQLSESIKPRGGKKTT
ncbi:guanine nucleotide-releasing factor 2 isoform X3 [Photinus pyralis]|uniref:CRK SH3-binding GNRP n=1 Tax=Photinus pyralis TaxID=7054 RepID=A0A1Y1KS29_PHOPY|nr:guanine nucleotide-releasing factor 2 isoform X3 [Photinus pyralis]